MTPAFWLALVFYLLAGAWTVLVAWPFMRDTRAAAVRGLGISARTAELLGQLEADARGLLAEGRAVLGELRGLAGGLDRSRLEAAVAALEGLPARLDALAGAKAVDLMKRI